MQKITLLRGVLAAGLTGLLLGGGTQATTLKIATVSPLTGSLAPVGLELKRGTQLAIQQMAGAFKQRGYDLELVALDDQASATAAPQVAKKVLGDPAILGVIGAVNSSVTNVLGSALAPAHLALISPTSTSTALTENGWNNFSRMVPPDVAQGVAAAKYLSEELGARKVVVVSDNTAYGNGLSKTVQSNLKKAGITVSAYLGTSDDSQITEAVRTIKTINPNAVYYGGMEDIGATLVKALRAAGVKATFMGGDGLDTPSFAERAGAAATGVVYSSGFGPIDANSGRIYSRLYQTTFKDPASPVSAYAYDATITLLSAMRSVIENGSGTPTRAQVSTAVRQVNIEACRSDMPVCETVSGPVAFDAQGERERSRVFIMMLNSKGKSEITTVKTVTSDSFH